MQIMARKSPQQAGPTQELTTVTELGMAAPVLLHPLALHDGHRPRGTPVIATAASAVTGCVYHHLGS